MSKENMKNSLNEFKDDSEESSIQKIYKSVHDWRSEEGWKMQIERLEKCKHIFPEDEYNKAIENIKRRYNGYLCSFDEDCIKELKDEIPEEEFMSKENMNNNLNEFLDTGLTLEDELKILEEVTDVVQRRRTIMYKKDALDKLNKLIDFYSDKEYVKIKNSLK